jgi:hypothetical protein
MAKRGLGSEGIGYGPVMTPSDAGGSERRCPRCGQGVIADIDFGGDDLFQDPKSRQVDVYTCGHEVERARLEVADAERLDVERRGSEETAAPTPIDEQD